MKFLQVECYPNLRLCKVVVSKVLRIYHPIVLSSWLGDLPLLLVWVLVLIGWSCWSELDVLRPSQNLKYFCFCYRVETHKFFPFLDFHQKQVSRLIIDNGLMYYKIHEYRMVGGTFRRGDAIMRLWYWIVHVIEWLPHSNWNFWLLALITLL